jgi:hypothetical protein
MSYWTYSAVEIPDILREIDTYVFSCIYVYILPAVL